MLLLRTCRRSQRGNCLARDLVLIHYRKAVDTSLNILLLVLSLLRMDLVLGLDSRWMTKGGWIGRYEGYLLRLRLSSKGIHVGLTRLTVDTCHQLHQGRDIR